MSLQGVFMFEDDLMLTSTRTPLSVAESVVAALESLPDTADVLYLEYCHEDCEALRFRAGSPLLARAATPGCTGAQFYTAKGARKVSRIYVYTYIHTHTQTDIHTNIYIYVHLI